jgi:hypothetical protein
MKKLLCSFKKNILFVFTLGFTLTTKAENLCSNHLDRKNHETAQTLNSFLNPNEDHELLAYTLDLTQFALDTVFSSQNLQNPMKPFLWLIKNPRGEVVGALFGTSHRYVSLNMFSDNVRNIISKADKVFLEHSTKLGGEVFHKLERLTSNDAKTFLSPESLKKIMSDEIEFLDLRNKAEYISGHLFFPVPQFNPYFKSPYGLKKVLYEFSEVATSELATQPIDLDSQIERLAQSFGARLSYLEVTNDYASEFTGADTIESVESMILSPGNIFIRNYIQLRQFLSQYRDRDLKAFELELQSMNPQELDLTLILRNRRWIPKIIESLKVNKFTLVVSGVFHHFGPENLRELLSPFGYQFELVE